MVFVQITSHGGGIGGRRTELQLREKESPVGVVAATVDSCQQALADIVTQRFVRRVGHIGHHAVKGVFERGVLVALTRAREELHIMLPVPGRTESERIGTLLDSVISRSGGEARLGDACGKVVEGEEGFSILFGTPSGPSETKPVQPPVLPAYGTTDISGRLAVRFDSQRYAEEGVADDRLSPRNYGVLLHRLFEQADNTDDIRRFIIES